MYLNLSELLERIKWIRNQLITSAETWIDAQYDDMLQAIKSNWRNAVSSANRDEMQRKLQEGNVPLVRADQLLHSMSVASSSLEVRDSSALDVMNELSEDHHYRSVYHPVVDDPGAHLVCLSQLTTIFDLLYQLEDYLSPLELHVSFRGLKLAHAMGVSMNNEWRFVEQGVETVRCYTSRLQQARQQFHHANADVNRLIHLNQAQINIRIRQFEETLHYLVSTVSAAYELQNDSRNRLVRMFSAYLPWHSMFHQLLTGIFGVDAVSHPAKDSIACLDSRVNEITTLVQNQNQIPQDAIFEEYQTIVQATESELNQFNRKLESMTGNLDVAEQMGALHHVALFLPTSVTGFYRFFNRLQNMPRRLGQADASLGYENDRVIDTEDSNRLGY